MSMVQENLCRECRTVLWTPEPSIDGPVAWIASDDAQLCAACETKLAKAPTLKPPVKADAFRVDDEQRLRLTLVLNRWLRDCAMAADDKWTSGASGYVGTFKLRMYCGDQTETGLTFTVESSIEADV